MGQGSGATLPPPNGSSRPPPCGVVWFDVSLVCKGELKAEGFSSGEREFNGDLVTPLQRKLQLFCQDVRHVGWSCCSSADLVTW